MPFVFRSAHLLHIQLLPSHQVYLHIMFIVNALPSSYGSGEFGRTVRIGKRWSDPLASMNPMFRTIIISYDLLHDFHLLWTATA